MLVGYLKSEEPLQLVKKETNEDDLINDCLEFDVEDINSDDEFFEITVNTEIFNDFCSYLESKKYLLEAELSLCPQNTVKISSKNSSEIIKLLTLLEEHEDIQKVYSNLEIEDLN